MALVPGYHGSGKMGRRRAMVLEAVDSGGQFGVSAAEIAEKSRIRDPFLSYALWQLQRKGLIRTEWQEIGKGRRYAIIATFKRSRLERGENGELSVVPRNSKPKKLVKETPEETKTNGISEKNKSVIEEAKALAAVNPGMELTAAIKQITAEKVKNAS